MNNVVVALENIRSLYNIGAIFRTCSFFGFKKVLLVGYTGKQTLPSGKILLHEKLQKTHLGSLKDLEIIFIESSKDLINFAKENNYHLVAIEQSENSTKLNDWKAKYSSIVVFGNEVEGVSKEVLEATDNIVEIPGSGGHNSLNVATTAGIVLAHSSGALVKR